MHARRLAHARAGARSHTHTHIHREAQGRDPVARQSPAPDAGQLLCSASAGNLCVCCVLCVCTRSDRCCPSHRSTTVRVRKLTRSACLQLEPAPGDVQLCILPCWHIFERFAEYYALLRGATLVYSSVKTFKKDLASYTPQVRNKHAHKRTRAHTHTFTRRHYVRNPYHRTHR